MSIVAELVKSVIDGVMREVKTKRARRRKRTATSSSTWKKIEELLRPAKKQTSRRKTTGTRSASQRKRVTARTQKHKKSLRVGKARR